MSTPSLLTKTARLLLRPPLTSLYQHNHHTRSIFSSSYNSNNNTEQKPTQTTERKDQQSNPPTPPTTPTTESNETNETRKETPPVTPQVDNAKIAELQNSYLQCLADMENLRARTSKEVEQSKQFAIQKFAKDLLDTVDVISMALNSVPKELLAQPSESSDATPSVKDLQHNLKTLFTGVTLMEAELMKALRRHGVERFEPIDQQFDPNLHQAMFQAVLPGKAPGTIFSVQKTGFTLNGRVIRPAQVGVVKEEN